MSLTIDEPKAFINNIQNQFTVYTLLMMPESGSSTTVIHIVSEMSTLSWQYNRYADVFSEENADKLSSHQDHDHVIETERHESLYDSLYNLSETELQVLREYLDNILVKKWIQHFISSAEASVLFVLKNEESLYLCVDYRDLNKITIKNCHSLLLISETLNWLSEVKMFIKLDLKNAYHCIRIKKDNEWKTAFHTCYSHFEYMIMSFKLINASATFQVYINWVLTELVNVFCVIYLNNILIYFSSLEEYQSHVKQILKQLWQFKLYANLKKCTFHTTQIKFLKFIIFTTDVSMNQQQVKIIKKWSVSRSYCEIQIFLEFANFYHCFIQSYSKVTASLTDLLKDSKNSKKIDVFKWS